MARIRATSHTTIYLPNTRSVEKGLLPPFSAKAILLDPMGLSFPFLRKLPAGATITTTMDVEQGQNPEPVAWSEDISPPSELFATVPPERVSEGYDGSSQGYSKDDPPAIENSVPQSQSDTAENSSDPGGTTDGPSHRSKPWKRTRTKQTNNKNNNNQESTNNAHSTHRSHGETGRWLLAVLIFLIGAATSAAFLSMGINGAQRDQDLRFERHASDFVKAFAAHWADYEVAAMWAHEACRSTADQVQQLAGRLSLCTREDFSELYLYLRAGGLAFNFVAFYTMMFGPEREALEAESRTYYEAQHPDFDYAGVTGYVRDQQNPLHFTVEARSEQPLYLTAHYVEPLASNEWNVDFDIMSIPRPDASEKAQEELEYLSFQPVLSERMIFPSQDTTGKGYNVVFLHPGISLPNHPPPVVYDPSGMGLYVPDLLLNVAEGQSEKTMAYVFDNDDISDDHEPAFLAGILATPRRDNAAPFVEYQEEVGLSGLLKSHVCRSEEIPVVNRHWIIVVCRASGTYEPELIYVILGGIFIFFSCCCLAIWLYVSNLRMARFNAFKAAAEREKAALLVKNAQRVAAAEKEMNEYIAHEIRNPVAAAIAACSFVSAAVNESTPLPDEESRWTVREDVSIISNSLKFTNDLLRTMIDMHKASDNRLHLDMAPTSILHDVLEPVATMFHTRGLSFDIQCRCEPPDMVVVTDRIRLKQIVLNLAGNAKKFVQQGYIRLSTVITVDGKVEVSVEDSGPGIPFSKRPLLFQKYQESLDSLSQGTGMGLCLCKSLSRLLGGDLFLDETFDSGIEGCPGTRFVLRLNQGPEDVANKHVEEALCLALTPEDDLPPSSVPSSIEKEESPLPKNLSVLIVDDDMILRRLISRTLRNIAPSWNIKQASNGETAIRLIEDGEEFDLILMDQYMASVEKTLLGTETCRVLRSKGVISRIVGLSANNMEDAFIEAGADSFMLKPIPCAKDEIIVELKRIIS